VRVWGAMAGVAFAGALLAGTVAPVAVASANAQSNTEIATDKGVVVGNADDTTRSFLGIPYASPPTGELRWARPRPAAKWTEPRDATHPGAACQQRVNLGTPKVPISEDCLYLNVYTPAGGGSKLPVMVWIHGGGFTGGQGADYDGRAFARDHDTIVVTVNYRVGIFGFLAATGLSDTSSTKASGNYGLEDQRAALEWVQRNIAAFGGDPHRVAIVGESAGAGSVCFHTASPRSKGLFQAAVMESGSCAFNFESVPTLREAETEGDEFAGSVGCAGARSAECLRSKSAEELLTAAGGTSTGGGSTLQLGPIVDGAFVPKQPAALIAAGRFNRVPVIIGSNSDEGTTFVFLSHELKGSPVNADEYEAELEKIRGVTDPAAALAHYPLDEYATPSQALAAATTDAFACPFHESAKRYARWVPTYAFEFADRNAPFPLGKLDTLTIGAGHGLELQYVFQTSAIPLISVTPAPFDAAQQAVSDSLTGYWARFIASRAPGKGGGPKWPRFDADRQERIVFGSDATTVRSDFEQEHQCTFWRQQNKTSAQ
jgi:para-nitrobenzyl esterase